jgi:RsbRD-like negative regulator of sigma factor
MNLENFLSERRSSIIKKWRRAIVSTYPEDTQRFLKKEKDQFANPVGNTISREVETLYDAVVGGKDPEKISACLEGIIRIRAVQDFKPSQAVAFTLQLKDIIRAELEGKALLNGVADEFKALETRINNMLFTAFDIYTQCRQKIYEIRVKEVTGQVGRLLKRANLVCEIPGQDPDL